MFIMSSLGEGGAEKVLVTMLKHFDYNRFDVSLALTSQSGRYLTEIPEQVKILSFFPGSRCFWERIAFSLYSRFTIKSLECFLVRRAVRESFDTIVSFCQGRPLRYHYYLLNRGHHNITWVHTDLYSCYVRDEKKWRLADEKCFYESMSELVFVSEEARRNFMKFDFSLQKASVIRNPIDAEEIRRGVEKVEERQVKSPSIVLCGRLHLVKAFDRMVRIAKRLRAENISFHMEILGEGPERENLQQLIVSENLQDVVCLRGFVSPPYPEMAQADVFVSCSLTEGYPLNVCEAMCLGLPIVATRCAGNTEVLADGKYGMLVDQDEDDLYRAVKEMLLNKEKREEYAERSRDGARLFDLKRVMEQVYDVL